MMPPAAMIGSVSSRARIRTSANVAELVVGRLRVEHSAMTAGLVALRDDRVNTGLGGHVRLGRAGGRREQHDAGGPELGDQLGAGYTEMEAHHFGLFGEQHRVHGAVDTVAAVDLAQPCRRLGAERQELRAEPLDPARLTLGVGAGWRVTEHVHVERSRRKRSKRCDHRAGSVGRRGSHPERTQAAGVADRRRQLGRGNAGHRRLEDGSLDPEEVEQASCPRW